MSDDKESQKADFEELTEYFELLCHILPLGNWRISLEASNSHDMSHYVATPEAYGACQKNRNMQFAEVFINIEKPRVDSYGETWEHTLIHEMLHVVTDEISEYVEAKYPDLLDDQLYCCKMERLINMLSYAIYDALALERSCGCDGEHDCANTHIPEEQMKSLVSKLDLTGESGKSEVV